jgi:hypothetical protein
MEQKYKQKPQKVVGPSLVVGPVHFPLQLAATLHLARRLHPAGRRPRRGEEAKCVGGVAPVSDQLHGSSDEWDRKLGVYFHFLNGDQKLGIFPFLNGDRKFGVYFIRF